jgi:3-oxoacyl-[acyl-carrier-protein] synthase III
MGMSIASIGYYLPEKTVSNDELLELVGKYGGTNADLDKLKKKLIINKAENRHFKNPNETGIDMAVKAAQKCLAKINFPAKNLDLILYAGMLRDYVEPAMSVFLQDILGAEKANALDISNACIGFLYGMEMALLYSESGIYRNILIVGAENGSERIPWRQFNSDKENLKGFSALTVSDGAAAMLLQNEDSSNHFKKFYFKTFGQYNDLCRIKIGKELNDLKLMVKSKQLAITALEITSEYIPAFVYQAEEILGEIDIIFFHQVTGEPRKYCGKLREELYEKCYNSFAAVGNTGSISIPLGMALAEEEGRLKKGDLVTAIVGASGFSFGGSAFIY